MIDNFLRVVSRGKLLLAFMILPILVSGCFLEVGGKSGKEGGGKPAAEDSEAVVRNKSSRRRVRDEVRVKFAKFREGLTTEEEVEDLMGPAGKEAKNVSVGVFTHPHGREFPPAVKKVLATKKVWMWGSKKDYYTEVTIFFADGVVVQKHMGMSGYDPDEVPARPPPPPLPPPPPEPAPITDRGGD